jgi:hypothetical protein
VNHCSAKDRGQTSIYLTARPAGFNIHEITR